MSPKSLEIKPHCPLPDTDCLSNSTPASETVGQSGRVVRGMNCKIYNFLTIVGVSALLLFTLSGKSMPNFIDIKVFELLSNLEFFSRRNRFWHSKVDSIFIEDFSKKDSY